MPGSLRLRYPEDLRLQSQSGEAWVSFVVQADSTADTTSFRVLLSDDPAFAAEAIRALRAARYRPARIGNVPVAARVYQRFTFRIR